MSMTRKRRILIAAVAAVGIFVIWAPTPSGDGRAFFAWLSKHPRLCRIARVASTAVGKEDEVNNRISVAILDRIIEEGGDVVYVEPPLVVCD
jgi:hypothetical protein